MQRLDLFLQLVPGHGGAVVVGLRLGELLLDIAQLGLRLAGDTSGSDGKAERRFYFM